ncbi:NADPH-dependent 2,4-dienoyl-CoA reductase/sulfur reductase-like enzyme [Ruminiclostridium sufflavum DSM 19573]|uniref:NADPH-dependent 2,4-dienoyl-CoA reductase/sulfur reductase-like enzyme n=1 Tax=Ruminiclostridium sufflavum DSM 19573 TaxID=1121337 RepID=A0A318XKP6_9FIRM|nr:DsrE/DsrF/DrsH-like family protein [Ruminiclostridium sufflavum]PYG87116.1 NADPH-dependent 2,4-dienoyl-CoA reductase/sulfur reductase-like enzyme [Ruminiclostridium sufflavum DSM 19573]
MNKKVLIIGGVAGGASTATRLRRLDESAKIIIFEKDEYISFANCGLPYYIGGVIQERDKLLLQTPQAIKDRFNIDVRIFSEVVKIDPAAKKVTVNSRDKGRYEEAFDYLVLSPGAAPVKPPIKGIDSKRIFSLRNVPDTDAIKAQVDKYTKAAQANATAIVIGGGFIGIETAENMIEKGLNVILVEAAPHILAPFDSEFAMVAEAEMESMGIELHTGDGVSEFIDEADKLSVKLASGKIITGDFVISAIGVRPATDFIKDSGIELGPKGHIVVDDHMRTNFDYIYGAGDAAEIVDFITRKKTAIPLAGPANRQARIIADNIAGIDSKYLGSMGTSIIKVFDKTAAATGMNMRNARRAGIDARAVFIHPNNHASYYPGAAQMSIKLVYTGDKKVIGAQAVGYDGVDKVIDVISTVIKFGGTVDDLAELELAYAPPYLSAKAPANMLGFVAQNNIAGLVENATIDEFNEQFDPETMLMLDVRENIESENGNIYGSINIPLNSIRKRMNEIPKDKLIWIYCSVGVRGYIAARILNQNGYRTKNLAGGYNLIKNAAFRLLSNKRLEEFRHKETGGNNSKNGAESNAAAMNSEPSKDKENNTETIKLDARGLSCPGPLMRVKAFTDEMQPGQKLEILASDPGFYEDIKSWCKRTNSELLALTKKAGEITALIKKGSGGTEGTQATQAMNQEAAAPARDNKNIVVFSGELDKALAAFIIANGAAAMGKRVTMFFTFWGLSILRKPEKVAVKKGFVDSMFGAMLPKGTGKLKLSKMNMMGMGTAMMKRVMKDKNISSVDELVKAAIDSGIELIACQMSMDVMGIKPEELIDGVKFGGVGYMLGEAEDSNVNFFI